MQIDHIIPVAKAKSSMLARGLLHLRGMGDVNAPGNLAPSCARCNRRKGDKMGLWYIRGVFGADKRFRVIYKALECIAVAAAAAAAISIIIILAKEGI